MNNLMTNNNNKSKQFFNDYFTTSPIDIKINNSQQNISAFEGKISIKCTQCQSGQTFLTKNEFLQHTKICSGNNSNSTHLQDSHNNNALMPSQEEINKTFHSIFDNIQSKFVVLQKDKFHEFFKNINTKFNTFQSLYEQKIDKIAFYENNINKLSSDDFVAQDEEYKNLIATENNLLNDKRSLIEQQQQKLEKFEAIQAEYENSLMEDIYEYKNRLLQLEIQEKWMKEDLEGNLLVTDFGGENCSSCGSDETTTKKYFCPNCRGKFCVGKCVQQCKGPNCQKYICPKDNKKCNLCHKLNYCDSCQKKCFFLNCNNSFCPECYKKNEHQARNQNINCKFFTCEKDAICDCLMTSLFCPKCEKRLCNKCLMNDLEHFPFLK
jgi:hypothetical protein